MKYLLQRVLQAAWALLGAMSVVFVLLHMSGDPATMLISPDAPNYKASLASMREALGLNRPVYVQFGRMLGRMAVGDFGTSFRERRPAIRVVLERLPATLVLAGSALILSTALGILLGVISAVGQGRWFDQLSMVAAIVGLTVPTFWLSMILVLVFGVYLGWFPTFGGGTASHVILPALALVPYSTAVVARISRSSMLDVLHNDYIRTARSKGLAQTAVVVRHALKNAALPIVTTLGLRAGVLVTGSIPVEVVFAYPGAGNLVVQAVGARDFPVVMAFVVVIATVIVTLNLITDLVYLFLDPRIRY